MKISEALLWPLSVPFEAATRIHAAAYHVGFFPTRKLDGFVISVGNLTVGGTGKTPMVLWIAQRLLAERKSVAILTRGYRGKPVASNAQGSSHSSEPANTSDEVQLLRSRLGDRAFFGVGADRFALGSELVARGVRYFVLDDGFKHRRLARDVDIVLIDATNPFGGGHLLPAGRLREPRSALQRADIIVITRVDHSPAIEAAIRQDSSAPIFYASPQLDSVYLAEGDSPAELMPLQNQKILAFCGVGNPRAFFTDLRKWGFQIAGQKCFPDHHRYTRADSLLVESEARNAQATALLCTEKDFFNLQAAPFKSFPLFFCRISLQVQRSDDFWTAVTRPLHSP